MSSPETVVVTGIGGRLGRLLVKYLHRTGDYRVLGIDRRRVEGLPKDVEHLRVDIRSKRAREVFRSSTVRALIHAGLMHNRRVSSGELHRWNVIGTSRLLDYCADYGVPKVVVLSSADVYGPSPENQQFLTEDAPLMGAAHFPGIRDLVSADMQATSFFWRSGERGAGGKIETVVLRPVHILGTVRNAPSNYLRLETVPVLMGYDPMVQVVHERDVVRGVLLALQEGINGVFNLTGPGEVPLSVLLKELGKRTVPVPAPLLGAGLDLAWKLRMTTFPAPEVALIRYVAMVDGTRAHNVMGFRPKYSVRETAWAVHGDGL